MQTCFRVQPLKEIIYLLSFACPHFPDTFPHVQADFRDNVGWLQTAAIKQISKYSEPLQFFWFPSAYKSYVYTILQSTKVLPRWISGKESICQARDTGSIPGLGRSAGEGNGNTLQYSCLGNPMDRGIWRATVHRVAKSQTRLTA